MWKTRAVASIAVFSFVALLGYGLYNLFMGDFNTMDQSIVCPEHEAYQDVEMRVVNLRESFEPDRGWKGHLHVDIEVYRHDESAGLATIGVVVEKGGTIAAYRYLEEQGRHTRKVFCAGPELPQVTVSNYD